MFKLKQLAVGVGVAALALSASQAAFASTLTFPGAVNYATQAVAAGIGGVGNTVAVPGGPGSGVKYTSNAQALATDTACTLQVLFVLPSGATFATTPSATVTGDFSLPVLQSVNGGSVQFQVTFTPGGAGTSGTLTLSTFNMTSAALGTPPGVGIVGTAADTFNISGQAFNEAPTVAGAAGCPDENDTFVSIPATNKTNVAGSANALAFVAGFVTPELCCAGMVIDITSKGGSFGKQFTKSGLPAATSTSVVGDLGAFTLGVAPGLVNQFDSAPFAFSSPTSSIVVAGNWQNIASAFIILGAGPTSCPASAPGGSFAGTVTATTITFSTVTFPLPAATPFGTICIVANGTGLLLPNPPGTLVSGAPTLVAGAGIPVTASEDTTTNSSQELSYAYNGAIVTFAYNLTGSNLAAGFTDFVRVVNTLGTSAAIPAIVYVDGAPDGSTSGATNTIVLIPTLAGNGGATIQVSSIIAAAGLTPPTDGRAFIQVLLPPGTFATHIMGNPNNTFVFGGGTP